MLAPRAQDGGQVQDAEGRDSTAAGPLAQQVVIAPERQAELRRRGDACVGGRGVPCGGHRAGQIPRDGLQEQGLAGEQVKVGRVEGGRLWPAVLTNGHVELRRAQEADTVAGADRVPDRVPGHHHPGQHGPGCGLNPGGQQLQRVHRGQVGHAPFPGLM